MLFKKSETAFLEVKYKENRNRFYGYAYSKLEDPQLAENAVQDTFEQMIKYHDNKDIDDWNGYAFGILKNLVKREIRKIIKQKDVLDINELVEEIDDRYDLEQVIIDQGTRRCMVRLVLALPDSLREPILLKYSKLQLKNSEIAQRLGIKENTVGVRICRAKKELSKGLKRADGE